jgi:hypothetical protein
MVSIIFNQQPVALRTVYYVGAIAMRQLP